MFFTLRGRPRVDGLGSKSEGKINQKEQGHPAEGRSALVRVAVLGLVFAMVFGLLMLGLTVGTSLFVAGVAAAIAVGVTRDLQMIS